MTQPAINPYEPVAHAAPVSPPSEPLVFDGAIEVADYQQMLPRDQEWWLIVVLAVLLGICIVSWRSKGTSNWRLKIPHLHGGGRVWSDVELLATRVRIEGRSCPIAW